MTRRIGLGGCLVGLLVALGSSPWLQPGHAAVAPTPAQTASTSAEQAEPALQTVPLAIDPSGPTTSPAAPAPMAAQGHGNDTEHETGQRLVQTAELEVDAFTLAAVTWHGTAPVTAWVRTRSSEGWSPWYELPGDDVHAPPADSGEAADTRNGTGPLLVPRSDAVQVRVDSPDPQSVSDLRLDLVSGGSQPSDADAAAADAPLDSSPAAGQPTILSRSAWGADESLRADPPEYGEVLGAFVHHTVNTNAYALADVPSIIRSIYTYHVQSRGWNDLGYNFLVDRFGRIWEGRAGGIDRAVIGAHALGYNDQSFGVSAIGTYTDTAPSDSTIRALQNLISWKFTHHGVNPLAAAPYQQGARPAIAGHRDVSATECPGDLLYGRLPGLRAGIAAAMIGAAPNAMVGGDFDADGAGDLIVRTPDGTLWFLPGDRQWGFSGMLRVGHGWQGYSLLAASGDLDGDGRQDLLARDGDGRLWLFSGNGTGGFTGRAPVGIGWDSVSGLAGVGDLSGDGRADLVARNPDGRLWLYPGNGRGWFDARRPIGTGWMNVSAMVGPGDFDGDGHVDLVARNPDGRLWLYPGNGRGWFDARRPIGSGWAGIAAVAGPGDFTGDGRADVLALYPGGGLRVFPGNGRGWFAASSWIQPPW